MNGTLNIFEESACPASTATTEIQPTPLPDAKNILLKCRIFTKTTWLLTALMVLVCLLVPSLGLTFDFGGIGKAFKDAADSVTEHITDMTQRKVDEGEKKVEEGIDQTLYGQSATPQQSDNQSKNTNVEVQQRLNALGFNAGPADGMLGSRSVTAIKAFQRDYGLPETGQVSPSLLAALQNANNNPASSASSSSNPIPIGLPSAEVSSKCPNLPYDNDVMIPEEEQKQIQQDCLRNEGLSRYDTNCCIEKFDQARLKAGPCVGYSMVKYNMVKSQSLSQCGYKNQAVQASVELNGRIKDYLKRVAIVASRIVCQPNDSKDRQIRANYERFLETYVPDQVSLAKVYYDSQFQRQFSRFGGPDKCGNPPIANVKSIKNVENSIISQSGKPRGLAPGAIP